MKKIAIFIVLATTFSCSNNENNFISTKGINRIISSYSGIKSNEKSLSKKNNIADTSEFITDSTHFGFINKTKIEFIRVDYTDSSNVIIRLSKKESAKWIQTQEVSIETTALLDLKPTFSDFNNDGYNDVLIETATSARGANEIQTLFLFLPKSKQLLWIKNSENFPNLDYNSELKCIEAVIFTGGLTTVFLQIKKDSLFEFAEVDQRDDRIVVTITDPKGNRKEIKNISNKGFSDMAHFKNYNPLKEY